MEGKGRECSVRRMRKRGETRCDAATVPSGGAVSHNLHVGQRKTHQPLVARHQHGLQHGFVEQEVAHPLAHNDVHLRQ